MRTALVLALGLAVLPSHSIAAEPPPEVALIVGRPGEETSRLVLQRAGSTAPSQGVATIEHLPWAVLRGRMLPGSRTALVVADLVRRGDGTFGSSLLRVSPGARPKVLADRVFHATRPLVTTAGRVFVERGTEGPEPSEDDAHAGRLRVDRLTVDEVDPATGKSRTVHAFEGYTTHLAGAAGEELILYRVRHRHADLVAVHMDSGAVRMLVEDMVPFARDFSIDEARGVLRWATRDPSSEVWTVVDLNLKSGARSVLARGPRPSLGPASWPGGGWAWNPGGNEGLTLVEGSSVKPLSPLGPGADVVRATSKDGRWVALDHTLPSSIPQPFVLSRDGKELLRLPIPEGLRAEVLGFVESRR